MGKGIDYKNIEMSIGEIYRDMSLLQTVKGREIYLLKKQKESSSSVEKKLINIILGDMYFNEGNLNSKNIEKDLCSAYHYYNAAGLEGERKVKIFSKLAEKCEANNHDLTYSAYKQAGIEDKIKEFALKSIDQEIVSKRSNYLIKLGEYQKHGLTPKESLDRILEVIDKSSESDSEDNLSYKESDVVHSLHQISHLLKRKKEDKLCSKYTAKFFEEYTKSGFSSRYRGDINMLSFLEENIKDKVSLNFLEALIKHKFSSSASAIIPSLSKEHVSEAYKKVVKGYLNENKPEKAFCLSKEHSLKDKHLWKQIALSLENQYSHLRAAQAYENSGLNEEASSEWLNYGDSIALKDKENAIKAYNSAGLNKLKASLRLGDKLLTTRSKHEINLGQVESSLKYFQEANLTKPEVQEKGLELKEILKPYRLSEKMGYLYEKFGLEEDAKSTYITLAKKIINSRSNSYDDDSFAEIIHLYEKAGVSREETITKLVEEARLKRTHVTQLKDLGVIDKESWIKLGERAYAFAKKISGDYNIPMEFRLASKAFEEAQYQNGSIEEMKTLADVYEADSEIEKALELRKRILKKES